MAGKGSTPRPVNSEIYSQNYDAIFKVKDKPVLDKDTGCLDIGWVNKSNCDVDMEEREHSQNPIVRYIISECQRDQERTRYVSERPGYMRCSDGTMVRAGSLSGFPGWTTRREHALEFNSHRAAALVLSKCASATITEVISNAQSSHTSGK